MSKFIFMVVFLAVLGLIVLGGGAYGLHRLLVYWAGTTRRWRIEDEEQDKGI